MIAGGEIGALPARTLQVAYGRNRGRPFARVIKGVISVGDLHGLSDGNQGVAGFDNGSLGAWARASP